MLFSKSNVKFITGNEAVVEGAMAAGAKFMAGYPITPATEILELWMKKASDKKNYIKGIQSEDETSAGFNTIGSILSGAKSFTASAGIGHVLMQDPISLAEAMRLPFVGVIMQRGGPSTGTVVYSQQEITLACYGGNGEGHRIVYSTSTPQELYDYTKKAFNTAWKYYFPTFVLGDGYQSKMKTKVVMDKSENVLSKPILGLDNKFVNIRNCYNFESQLSPVLKKNIADYENMSAEVTEFEQYKCNDAELIIFAHGIVANSAKIAVDIMRTKNNKKIGMFRPITLRPFPKTVASNIASKVGKVLVVESSNGHFARIIKENLYALARFETLFKPVEGISPEDIVAKINEVLAKNDNFWTEH
jgi:2-oxoglutarate ferredoxin oxidoreductase subunit alpha